uniref:C2 domain-containing protein n=1 Tax=Lates calcarifer TaxID=8187 RepID=A0A4W6ELN3_LATCA
MKLAVFVSLLVIIPFQVANSCIGKKAEVWVENGHHLRRVGHMAPNPYVLKIGRETIKTKVVYSSANPYWRQKFEFQTVLDDMLTIDVWDEDTGFRGDDVHLGTCMEPMISVDSNFHIIQCNLPGSGFVKFPELKQLS